MEAIRERKMPEIKKRLNILREWLKGTWSDIKPETGKKIRGKIVNSLSENSAKGHALTMRSSLSSSIKVMRLWSKLFRMKISA